MIRRKKLKVSEDINNNSLNGPGALAFDDIGNLWVADIHNNRILMYKADRRKPFLFYNGQPASLVLGQDDFTSDRAPDPPTASSLNYPLGIGFDACNLWVCDSDNNRVLMYRADWRKPDLFYNSQPASLVLGQQEFASNSIPVIGGPNDPLSTSQPLSADVLQMPNGIAFDSDRNLWVGGWARVLRFSFPIFSHQSASLVIGKPDFLTPDTQNFNFHTTNERSAWDLIGLTFDKLGNLWLADDNEDRITMYTAITSRFLHQRSSGFTCFGRTKLHQ
jgi:hypothetical protein